MLVMTITLVLSSAQFALAQQDEKPSSVLGSVVKGVILDPTTYAPAILGYHSTMKDWNTSQPFFNNGYVEHNARFTVTGRANDAPVSYIEGRNRILRDAITTLSVAAAQNATSRLVEQALLARYPDHRKAVKTVGWIQRIALGSLMSYHLSASHYRQAALNAQRAKELGY
jgi:hypothetical protein